MTSKKKPPFRYEMFDPNADLEKLMLRIHSLLKEEKPTAAAMLVNGWLEGRFMKKVVDTALEAQRRHFEEET